MTIVNLVIIDGKEVEIDTLPDAVKDKLADNLNTRALKQQNYCMDDETA